MILDVGLNGDIDHQTYERLVAACKAVDEAEVETSHLKHRLDVMQYTHRSFFKRVVNSFVVMHDDVDDLDK